MVTIKGTTFDSVIHTQFWYAFDAPPMILSLRFRSSCESHGVDILGPKISMQSDVSLTVHSAEHSALTASAATSVKSTKRRASPSRMQPKGPTLPDTCTFSTVDNSRPPYCSTVSAAVVGRGNTEGWLSTMQRQRAIWLIFQHQSQQDDW